MANGTYHPFCTDDLAILQGNSSLPPSLVECTLSCSGHGSCDWRTKKCVCDSFWMENPVTAHTGRRESNCREYPMNASILSFCLFSSLVIFSLLMHMHTEWSVFYVILVILCVVMTIVIITWMCCCCCLRRYDIPVDSSSITLLHGLCH